MDIFFVTFLQNSESTALKKLFVLTTGSDLPESCLWHVHTVMIKKFNANTEIKKINQTFSNNKK